MLRRYTVKMAEKWEKSMKSNLAYILELPDLSEANEEFALVSENMGYDPYDNPGPQREFNDEADLR